MTLISSATLLMNWDVPSRITYPFAPNNGSMDASIRGVEITYDDGKKETRTEEIPGTFKYTIPSLGDFTPTSSLDGV